MGAARRGAAELSDAGEIFRGTAAYYARYRPGYPAELIDQLLARFPLDGATAVDLGCGTGQIAIPLAARGVRVIAIDPAREMLDEAARQAARAGVSISLVHGVAEDLPSLVKGPIALVVAATSFHWMDRERVLQHCDRLVTPGGGVAIIAGAPSAWSEPDAVSRAIVDVIREFLGPERRAGAATYREPALRHDEVLRRSPFSVVEHWQTAVRYERTVDELVGLQLSTSHASPGLLGNRLDAFVTRLRERLLEVAPDGHFVETATLDAFCAYRP